MASGTFWSDASPGVRDPKRQFRWVLYNDNIPMYTLKKVAKPSFTVQPELLFRIHFLPYIETMQEDI